jgi:hypothetical protein
MAVKVRRFSAAHLEASVTVGGRGLFFSRTPDGSWWALRLRVRRCGGSDGLEDAPPDGGVREPRPPIGPNPGRGVAIGLPE